MRGGEGRISFVVTGAPFLGAVVCAAAVLAGTPATHWDRRVLRDEWVECLVSIPVIAIVPFSVVIRAARRAAPTDLVRAGAFAGLVAGSISAMAYALHCTDDSLAFVTAEAISADTKVGQKGGNLLDRSQASGII